jgi:hypothetical protein
VAAVLAAGRDLANRYIPAAASAKWSVKRK